MGDSILSERERRELGALEQKLRDDDRRLDEMLRLFVHDGWVRRLRWTFAGRRRSAPGPHSEPHPGT
jgi:hypothetical protein